MPKLKKIVFHPAVFLPVLLIAFLGTAILAKIFLWPSIKKYQANEYKKEANYFFEKGNYRNAFIEIRKAIL